MKKLITLLMIVLLLAGCSGRKSNDSPITAKPEQPAVKPAAEDPSEKYYGTWRSSAVYTNDVRFDMEQITALGGEAFDLIFIINRDGKVVAYSSYYNQIEEVTWTMGENNDSIIIGDLELFMEEDELVMNADEDKLYLAKISERQDRDYLDELLEEEKNNEDTKPTEEPEPEPELESAQEQEQESASENTIRPEVKEAIDAYEAFVDEYCEFMKKYSESDGTDLSILTDYFTFMSKLENYSDKMDAMEDDLTDAEYWYYIEVLNRCNEKMLKAAS